jgi:hypothetical protein
VQAHVQVRGTDEGVRDTRALREALEQSIQPLEDDLLELLAQA